MQDKVLFVKDNHLGVGSAELGNILMRGFFRQLKEGEVLPKKIIFINNGVKLLIDEEVLESLTSLEERGVELLACGTCLDYYGLLDKIRAGQISNMKEIKDVLMGSDEVVTL